MSYRFRCRAAAALAVLLAAALLCSCKGKEEEKPEGAVPVYRTDAGYSSLVCEYYVPESEGTEVIGELLEVLGSAPDSSTLMKIIPDEVSVLDFSLARDGALAINFSPEYNSMEPLREILCRAGVVKTMCSLDPVKSVEFLIDGQALLINGETMAGGMSGEEFIDNTGAEASFRQTVLLTVYYASPEGDSLTPVRLFVESSGTRSREELVMDLITEGPAFETDEYFRTVPEGTAVNKISTRDGICYVDLNKDFLGGCEGVDSEVTVYSIVNTLTELNSVTKVRITVDSETVKSLGDVALDGFLENRPDLMDSERAGEKFE